MDAGGLAHMNYNNNNSSSSNGLGMPGAGFGNRASRLNSKRLSVALPPKVSSINENQVDNPTPRTSRSHLLAGLRTQPRTPAVPPASAPYNQTQHQGLHRWNDQNMNGYNQAVPQTATAATFDGNQQYSVNAGRQVYSLPEQVLAPPSFYEQGEEMDPNVLQQMQLTSMFLAQRQQQLQQQLANITAAATTFQGLSLNSVGQRSSIQNPMTPQTPQNFYAQQQQQQQQLQTPVEVQPGVYVMYNPATQSYSYAYDPSQQGQTVTSPQLQGQVLNRFSSPPAPSVSVSPPPVETATTLNSRPVSPPKKAPSPPSGLDTVEPLPPPSATAFRRGHKKANSLAINPSANVADGMKTASAATFGTQRSVFPPTPMTGTFGPGAGRAGEHPMRQPRGPPQVDELKIAPTSRHEGSKNFASRQRRRALDSLAKAGAFRRSAASRSASGSPASEAEFFNFNSLGEEGDEFISSSFANNGSRKMSPIGSEMKEKRNSQGSSDGYFGLSSASSSEGEDGLYKQPHTPATPVDARSGFVGGDRKRMLGGLLNAAEKRKSFVV